MYRIHFEYQVSFYGPQKRKVLLDYILVREKWCKSVSDCDVKCVPSIASDHNLIRAKVRWVLKNNKMVKGRKRKVLSCQKILNVQKPSLIMLLLTMLQIVPRIISTTTHCSVN